MRALGGCVQLPYMRVVPSPNADGYKLLAQRQAHLQGLQQRLPSRPDSLLVLKNALWRCNWARIRVSRSFRAPRSRDAR
jgi:hypothetical protein